MYLLLSALLAWFFYYWRRKDFVGGFLGTAFVALIGCILGAFAISDTLKKIIYWLQEGSSLSNVDIIASLIGGYVFLYVFNRFNHNRERKTH